MKAIRSGLCILIVVVLAACSAPGQADAALKADEKGSAIGGKLLLNPITVCQLTETGLALQATVMATRYWVDTNRN